MGIKEKKIQVGEDGEMDQAVPMKVERSSQTLDRRWSQLDLLLRQLWGVESGGVKDVIKAFGPSDQKGGAAIYRDEEG